MLLSPLFHVKVTVPFADAITDDGIYDTEEYQHFAVIHVRLSENGKAQDIEIELNEFQVQMAVDKLPTYKIGEGLRENLFVNEKYD